jgi:glycerol-3-phosphate acyltransferase PlsY
MFLGFRGGRGEATTIGVFLVLLTTPTLIVAPIAFVVLYLSKNVIVTSTFLFVLIVLMTWWMNFPGDVVLFSILLPCLVGITHFVRSRETVTSEAEMNFYKWVILTR